VVGVVALLFGTRALLKVLRIVYGLVWGVTPAKLKRPALSMLGVLGLTTALFAFAALIGDLGERSIVLGLVGVVAMSVVPFGITIVASWYLPRQPVRWQDLIPGAFVVAVGVLLLHIVTVYWIAREVESKTDTYGAIGAALALLLWSYLLGRLITASAVINASLWQQRQERAERRAARALMHRPSPGSEGRQSYTPTARPESAPSTAVRREGTDGRAEPRS
jgi:membrane protein